MTEAASRLATAENESSNSTCPTGIQPLVPTTPGCAPSTSAVVSGYLGPFTRGGGGGRWPDALLVLAAWREAGERPVGGALWMLL